MKTKSSIKNSCEQYLGNRGICEPVKRCAKFDNLWFIVFDENQSEVEVSFVCGCYEPYTFIPSKDFKWNKANYEAIKNNLTK